LPQLQTANRSVIASFLKHKRQITLSAYIAAVPFPQAFLFKIPILLASFPAQL